MLKLIFVAAVSGAVIGTHLYNIALNQYETKQNQKILDLAITKEEFIRTCAKNDSVNKYYDHRTICSCIYGEISTDIGEDQIPVVTKQLKESTANINVYVNACGTR